MANFYLEKIEATKSGKKAFQEHIEALEKLISKT